MPGYCENACRRKKVDIPFQSGIFRLFVSQETYLRDQIVNVSGNPENIRESEKEVFFQDRKA